jgi:hypothetical protein
MTVLGPELAKMLKKAKAQKMRFTFVCKGSEGKLLVGKGKPKGKDITAAKEALGGGTLVHGKCSGPLHDLVFEVAKDVPATLAAVLKKHVLRHAKLKVKPTFQLAGDAEDEEEVTDEVEVEDEEDSDDASDVEDEEDSEDSDDDTSEEGEEDSDEDASDEEEEEPELDLSGWQAARQKAITGLKALQGKVVAAKHQAQGKVDLAGVLKEIQKIIAALPATIKHHEVDKLANFISTDDTIAAVDEVPDEFHNQDLRDELLAALKSLSGGKRHTA